MTGRRFIVSAILACSVPAGPAAGARADNQTIEIEMRYQVVPSPGTAQFRMIVAVPQSVPRIQEVLSIQCSPSPVRIFTSQGTRYAEFLSFESAKPFDIRVIVRLRLYTYNLDIAQRKPNPQKYPVLSPYLVDERYIEKGDPAIQQAAQSIRGNNEVHTVKLIYDFVISHLTYRLDLSHDRGAAAALRDGVGDCTEFADLMVALCRAKNLPARHVTGLTTDYIGTPVHSWVEVYFEKYGWVPFDPTWGKTAGDSFREAGATRVYISNKRNDPILGNSSYMTYWYWGDPATVTDTYTFRHIGFAASPTTAPAGS